MIFGLEQKGGSLIAPMALAHPLHPIDNRSRNMRRNLWVGRCVSSWWPWFPSRSSVLVYMYIYMYVHSLYEFCYRSYVQWASCQIRKIAGAHAPGMPGTFSLSPHVSDPDMHHGTCVTHVPWCMPGSLTSGFLWNRWQGKTFPAFPAHAQPAILRIW